MTDPSRIQEYNPLLHSPCYPHTPLPSPLDHIVKGTPAPNAHVVAKQIHKATVEAHSLDADAAERYEEAHQLARQPPSHSDSSDYARRSSDADRHSPALPPTHDANDRLASIKTPRPFYHSSDPASLLPSSPPQIYLNLLILEASLRSQFLTLRARRRQNTFFLTGLTLWILYFGYLQLLYPRDDGKIGGSQYWLVNMTQMLCLTTGILTAILFYAIGQWERGVRWPRRWINIANRGLRGMNAKIVIIRGPWWVELLSWASFMMPFSGGLWGGETGGSSYHYINLSQEKKHDLSDGIPRQRRIEDGKEYAEEDIAPGGDFIKLILLPKPFSPDFRENWELYRTEYWERENERRAELRKRVQARKREVARADGGWLWWTGWRGWKNARGIKSRHGHGGDLEKSSHAHAHHASHSHTLSASNSFKDRKRRPSNLRGRDTSHSRSSSRSTTPSADIDDSRFRSSFEPRERRWSNSTTSSAAPSTRSNSHRKKPSPTNSSTSTITQSSAQAARQGSHRVPSSGSVGGGGGGGGGSSRPTTPNDSALAWQSKRASLLSTSENISDYDGEGEGVGDMGPPPLPRQGSRGGLEGRARRRGSGERKSSSGSGGDVFPNALSA
ncbi:Spo7-like protein-domain-containing protein [Dendryphion nanum]|uniref:Spo7-like protein-domain-containing protein n=1 Tax=Dendryphion nanum TaxID=256645 RepID=A0A9P9E0M2_9PLEO|nr:Spo7-like protein-domain-containing protein [Dendryphion nanum]